MHDSSLSLLKYLHSNKYYLSLQEKILLLLFFNKLFSHIMEMKFFNL